MSVTEGAYEGSTTQRGEAAAQAPPVRRAPPLPQDPRAKSVPLACVLSAMPGLGQVYVGYYQRGFAHAIITGVIVTLLDSHQVRELVPLLGMFLGFFWMYNIIDAGRRASLYNQALFGAETIEPPRDFRMPGTRGSVAGGLVLIAIGGILLSNTRFGYELDWLDEWWPVAPILLGIYLVAKAMQDRMAASPKRTR